MINGKFTRAENYYAAMNPSEKERDGMGFSVELVLTEQSDGWPTDNGAQLLLKKHTKL